MTMQAPSLLTLTAAELIQGMCYTERVTGVASLQHANTILASFPPRVQEAALKFVRARLHSPRAKEMDYVDILCARLEVSNHELARR